MNTAISETTYRINSLFALTSSGLKYLRYTLPWAIYSYPEVITICLYLVVGYFYDNYFAEVIKLQLTVFLVYHITILFLFDFAVFPI